MEGLSAPPSLSRLEGISSFIANLAICNVARLPSLRRRFSRSRTAFVGSRSDRYGFDKFRTLPNLNEPNQQNSRPSLCWFSFCSEIQSGPVLNGTDRRSRKPHLRFRGYHTCLTRAGYQVRTLGSAIVLSCLVDIFCTEEVTHSFEQDIGLTSECRVNCSQFQKTSERPLPCIASSIG